MFPPHVTLARASMKFNLGEFGKIGRGFLSPGYARALHVLHSVSGNHNPSSLLETSSTSVVRDTGAIVYEIRGLRHHYSVTGRHSVSRRKGSATEISRLYVSYVLYL